jgi:hypothetical protein
MLYKNMKQCAETQRNIRLNDKLCRTSNGAVAFTCDYIGRSGILSDERHTTLYRVLSNIQFFKLSLSLMI